MPRAALLLPLFATLACHDPVSPVPLVATGSPLMARSAPQMFNEDVPFSFIVTGCTSEVVSVSGEVHSVTKVWNTAEEFRAMVHQNLTIVGIGLSTGRQYRLLETLNSDFELTWSSGNSVQHLVSQLKLIAPGALSDWRLTMHGTYVYEDGVLRFVPHRLESLCT